MKTTLSSPGSSSTTTNSPDPHKLSPASSPRSSPRPSPRPQAKQAHQKTPTDPGPFQDGSLSCSINQSELTQQSDPKTDSAPSGSSSGNNKKEPRTKKKPSWFNSLYPTYKSRSEDFKRIFKEVPDEERLVVDYSCALQKEILVQGRLYISQDYLCFYANIFGWETNVTLKWKEVTSISKEKTALVIPNAVLISTRTEQKYFFTSFVTRDKTYVMLFRVWQNALMDQPMTAAELWQWVHQCYGDELGLTSDDEDYIAPGTEEDKLSVRSLESFSENECALLRGLSPLVPMEEADEKAAHADKSSASNLNIPAATEPTDSDSDVDRPIKSDVSVKCTASHEGRQLGHAILPIHIDELFTLLFTSSKFFLDFHAGRKTTDLTQTPWTHNQYDNGKSRVVNQTIALSNTMGPKTAQVTESQTMLPCSRAGHLYSINVQTVNAGVPYADSFVVLVHYCLKRVSDTHSSFTVYGQINYKKHVWGLVKGMIEKNCWSGLDDFFTALIKALQAEAGDLPEKRKSKRRKRTHSTPKIAEKSRTSITGRKKIQPDGLYNSQFTVSLIVFVVLLILVFLNVMLYMKLWSLEETPPYTADLHILQNLPKSHDEWIQMLQKQESIHTIEVKKWQNTLKNAVNLLRQAEESLLDLQLSINPGAQTAFADAVQNESGNGADAPAAAEL